MTGTIRRALGKQIFTNRKGDTQHEQDSGSAATSLRLFHSSGKQLD
jgi:hypothetical protein